jgi:hypothetical protein
MVKDTRARNPAFAFFLFHLHVGTRLALRTFVPLVCVVFALFYILRPEFFSSLVGTLLQGGFLLSGLPATLFSLTVAGLASRRIGLGLSGWIRHLPVDSATHRRTAGLAVFVAQCPALLILAVLGLAATEITGLSVAPYLAGLPLLGLASGLAVLPVKRRIPSRVLAILGCLCFSSARWGFFPIGAVLLAAADRISGPLTLKRKRPVFRRTFPGKFFLFSLGWRALWPRLFIPYVLALFPLGAARLFALNNNLAPALSDAVARFGGAMGLVIFSALFSHLLALRRPPWPWARSLPLSAKQRVLSDSLFISLHTLPLLVLSATMGLLPALSLIIASPSLALWAASSVRQTPSSRTGALGRILIAGTLAALLLSLMPWASFFVLSCSPFILKQAIQIEQRHKVSRWLELHHLAAGDSLSWSKQ